MPQHTNKIRTSRGQVFKSSNQLHAYMLHVNFNIKQGEGGKGGGGNHFIENLSRSTKIK